MRAVGLFFIAVVMVGGLGPAFADSDLYAAIAYSPLSRTVGTATDKDSQAEAESVALANCNAKAGKATDCRNANWTKNACLSVGRSSEGAWGISWGVDVSTADDKAVAECSKYTKRTCKPVSNVCTSNNQK